jgi:hypothetical protein
MIMRSPPLISCAQPPQDTQWTRCWIWQLSKHWNMDRCECNLRRIDPLSAVLSQSVSIHHPYNKWWNQLWNKPSAAKTQHRPCISFSTPQSRTRSSNPPPTAESQPQRPQNYSGSSLEIPGKIKKWKCAFIICLEWFELHAICPCYPDQINTRGLHHQGTCRVLTPTGTAPPSRQR